MMKLRVILTGATGMVGEGVLHECLSDDDISEILIINRRPSGITHPKLRELLLPDFFDLSSIQASVTGYQACFFCLGVSSVGMSKDTYFKLTYTLTLNFAGLLAKQNPDMVFWYISGAGTDSTEKGRIAWARVKGKTENDLMKLPFQKVYLFRPGLLEPTRGLKNTLGFYKWLGWMIPLIRLLAPLGVTTLRELGLAMIHAATRGYPKQVLEVKDILELAKSRPNK
jgi:uncharacterized protein YbjT (DUF2867 family)